MQIHFFLTTQQGDVLEVDMRKGNVKDQEKTAFLYSSLLILYLCRNVIY